MVMDHEEFTPEEFRKRTWMILEQYKKAYESKAETFYDVTLAVNCLLGLLIEPKAEFAEKLSKKSAVAYLNLKKNGLCSSKISIKAQWVECEQTCDIQFNELITGLRNGLAHWGQAEIGNQEKNEKKAEAIKKQGIEYVPKAGKVTQLRITGLYDNYNKSVTATFYLSDDSLFDFLKLIKPDGDDAPPQQAQPRENQNTPQEEHNEPL